jgi:BolA protein
MSTERMQILEERLQALNPTYLQIIDESHLHAGHEGSRNGASHFRVVLWAPGFENLSTLARHRAVYQLVDDLIPYPVHALAVVAKPNP